MKLRNPDQLLVEREKIVDYLLNPAHRYGASKARFFIEFGFRVDAWEQLTAALREHGQTNEVARMSDTGFGPRYAVEGELNTPSGRRPQVRTVWQMDNDAVAPGSSARILWRQSYDQRTRLRSADQELAG